MRILLLGLGLFLQCDLALADQFEVVYKDTTNDLSWGQKLPGKYTNGCLGLNVNAKCTRELDSDGNLHVKVDDSDAAKACREIGARLPTQFEFQSLIRNFDHIEQTYAPRLTALGRKELAAALRANESEDLWSSSLVPKSVDFAWVLLGDYGVLLNVKRSYLSSVRCVSR